MGNSKKIISGIGLTLLILILIGYFSIQSFLNPSRYRDQISQMFYAKTQQHLVINGPIELHVFPWIGFRINNIQISNPPPFLVQPFANIGSLELRLKFLPLFHKELDLKYLVIRNPVFNFIKDKTGKTNLQALEKTLPQQATTPDDAGLKTKPQTDYIRSIKNKKSIPQKSSTFYFDIDRLDIVDGNIHWLDENTGQSTTIQQFNVRADNLASHQTTRLASSFTLSNSNQLQLAMNIASTFQFDNKKFDIQRLEVLGDLNYNGVKQHLVFSDDNDLIDLNKPQVVFTNALVQYGQIKGHLTINADAQTVHFAPFDLQNGTENLQGDILLTLTPSLKASVHLNSPHLSLHQWVNSSTPSTVDLSGTFKFDANLSSPRFSDLKTQLSGNGELTLSQGEIVGIEPSTFLAKFSILNKLDSNIQDYIKTSMHYDNISASFAIANGIIGNHDLSIQGKDINGQGDGIINLNNNTLNYSVVLTLNNAKKPNDSLPVDLKISGPFSDLKKQIDFKKMGGQVIVNNLLDRLKQKFKLPQ